MFQGNQLGRNIHGVQDVRNVEGVAFLLVIIEDYGQQFNVAASGPFFHERVDSRQVVRLWWREKQASDVEWNGRGGQNRQEDPGHPERVVREAFVLSLLEQSRIYRWCNVRVQAAFRILTPSSSRTWK